MKFSWKIFFITFLIIITSFGVGGFLLINTVFTNTLNNRIDSAKKNNNYITTALSVYADNNKPTYGNWEYLRTSAIGFAKQIAGNSDSKSKIGSINELSFSAENEFAHGMSVNSRKSRIVTENKKYYIQTISKIQLVTASCYIETVDDITSVYSDRDMYCTIYQFILIGVALFASILLVIFSKLLTRPLVKLKDASKEIAKGNFNMRVKESRGITSSTEITELSQSFNTMADYVEDYIEQLKLAAQNRDNFIADFTHELKTPLTSVIGYADMLRSYEMEPEQRRECADLIYKEGSRLEALSLNLLNLIV
ncbi:sensor histidine kinase [Ruminococcus bromii]|nr:sensor histidine kinase [Ruminococcus bromii]